MKPLFVPGLTYAELLRFSILLKLGSLNHSATFVDDRLDDILTVMDLQKCRNRKIPDRPQTRGELGCDFRRLGISLDIANLPPLIVINEPTLSFDPAISVQIISCLKALSARGHAILCSWSRPYKQELIQIDNVILLSEGYTIFSSSASHIARYFCSAKVGYELKEGVDIVDFMMDIASGVERPSNSRTAELPSVLQQTFEVSEFFDPPHSRNSVSTNTVSFASAFDEEHFAFLGYKLKQSLPVMAFRSYVVLQRAFMQKVKDTEAFAKLLFGVLLISTLIGYLEYKQGQFGYFATSLLGLPYLNTANITTLFFFLIAFAYTFPSANTSVVVARLKLFRYEQSSGYCNTLVFYFPTLIIEGLATIVFATIFATIMNTMIGFSKGWTNYFFLVYLMNMTMFVGQTTLHLCCSIFKTERLSRDIFFLMIVLQIFVSGYCFPIPSIENDFLFQMSGLSPLRWGFEGFMVWKLSFYNDGQSYLSTYGFDNFQYLDIFPILGNFLVFGNLVLFFTLLKEPTFLKIERPTLEPAKDVEAADRQSRSSVESDDVVWDMTPSMTMRAPSRQSELVKPVLFTRESSSVTGRGVSKLSINISQTGTKNLDKGPTVMFRNLNFKVKDRKSPQGVKNILTGVSGQFDWGKLSVIMGAVEAGKSSLLHVLAGDVARGCEITGDVLYDGVQPKKSLPLWQRCGLVSADYYFFRDLSVKEILTYAMSLRCLHREAFNIIQENVDRTIEILHLHEISHKKAKLLSPGEIRRLAIAEEMVHGPKLLFLDEPTSGVNLAESAVLMSTFREMVNQDRTVIVTVHQPLLEVFSLFDTLLLLSKGRVIYFGPVNQASTYFSSGPWQFDPSHYHNPADFLAEISGVLVPSKNDEHIDSTTLEAFYQETDAFKRLNMRLESSTVKEETTNPVVATAVIDNGKHAANLADVLETDMSAHLATVLSAAEERSNSSVSLIESFIVLLWKTRILLQRSVISLGKRFQLVLGSIVLYIILASMFGWVMGDCNNLSSGGVLNLSAFLGISSVFILLTNLQIIFFIHNNIQVFFRENARQLYSLTSFWIVNPLPMYLLRAISVTVFCLIVYSMAQLHQSSGEYGFFIFTYILTTICGVMMTETLVYMTDDVNAPYLSLSALAALQFIFSNLFIKPGSLPGKVQFYILKKICNNLIFFSVDAAVHAQFITNPMEYARTDLGHVFWKCGDDWLHRCSVLHSSIRIQHIFCIFAPVWIRWQRQVVLPDAHCYLHYSDLGGELPCSHREEPLLLSRPQART